MATAKNKVIVDDYAGNHALCSLDNPSISTGFLKKAFFIDKENVSSYELITDEHKKISASGVARRLVGSALLGPVGMRAGSISAKGKGIFQVAIEFRDGKKSLIKVDDKIYNAIVKSCF